MDRVKILILGLYTSNEDKTIIKLMIFSYENWCLMGGWNRVIFPQMKELLRKNIKITQGNILFDGQFRLFKL